MKTRYFEIKRKYEISCKIYEPDGVPVSSVILGVHGFAGDKESSALELLARETEFCGTALVCFDFPAHGASKTKEDSLTVNNCKKDLLAVSAWIIKQYPGAVKSVFATSFGGFITLLCMDNLPGWHFVLRAPAVTMLEILLKNVLGVTSEEFENAGTVRCGYERKLDLPYSFYTDLQKHADAAQASDSPMLIIHGSADNTVPYEHVKDFCRCHPNAILRTIEGADHRFKKPGELEEVVKLTREYVR